MITCSEARLGALCVLLAGTLAMTRPVEANLLIDGEFDILGPNGSPVVTVGLMAAPAAAAGWRQVGVVGMLTTTLLPSTDPFGPPLVPGNNMMHITSDSGPGNGFVDTAGFSVGLEIGIDYTLTFDLNVISGSVTGGWDVFNGSASVFPPANLTFGPTGGWIHVIEPIRCPSPSCGDGQFITAVAFETLAPGQGADYFIDNAIVTTAPEPGSLALLAAALLGFAAIRRRSLLDHWV
jgi:hypothetical protein